MGDELMKPQPHDSTITIPVTFDYRGGRGVNVKAKTIAAIAIVLISIIVSLGLAFSDLNIFFRIILIIVDFYIALFLLRFIVFRELHFSDVYEELLSKDFKMDMSAVWQIFEVSENYPYICFFRNGQKGLFVRMEMGTITGKSDTVMYDHYEAISDAYNIAHSLNMNMIHIDYMDNVGNDDRMKRMYEDLYEVKNPEMRSMLVDIYDNIQEEMTRNYANYDIYLFLTSDRADNFLYNVQNVCSKMTEGNFITYRIMDANEIATTVKALFNLHEFSVLNANEETLLDVERNGIVPLRVIHADGSIEVFNKPQAEQRLIAQENSRRLREQMHEKKARERNKNRGIDPAFNSQEQINLFSSLDELGQVGQQPMQNNINQQPVQVNLWNQQPMNQQQMNQQQMQRQPLNFNQMQNQQSYNPSQQLFKNGQVLNNQQVQNQQNQNNSANLFK